MGMFDYVHVAQEIKCPTCEEPVTGWQSKSGPCELLTLVPAQVSEFYTSCKSCNTWVQFNRRFDLPDVTEYFYITHKRHGSDTE